MGDTARPDYAQRAPSGLTECSRFCCASHSPRSLSVSVSHVQTASRMNAAAVRPWRLGGINHVGADACRGDTRSHPEHDG